MKGNFTPPNNLDSLSAAGSDTSAAMGSVASNIYGDKNLSWPSAASGQQNNHNILSDLTIVDNSQSPQRDAGQSTGFWSKLINSIAPESSAPGGSASGAESSVLPNIIKNTKPAGDHAYLLPNILNQVPSDSSSSQIPGDTTSGAGAGDGASSKPGDASTTDVTTDSGSTSSTTEQIMRGITESIGKKPQELQKDINPRLGCALMASHVLHQADPTFPETNNNQEFQKALKAHGYEAVTVQPGDPAINNMQAGDVVVGSRPGGMPGHAAISMGDGTVFNNNSDAGQGQLDSADQFNQGMHDKSGHWQKNGFSQVTIYRKASQASPEIANSTGS